TLDRHPHRAERQTSLGVVVRVRADRRDDGVEEQAVLALERADEEASQDADLRRREPDALGVVHQLDHPLAHGAKLVVDLLDLLRAHPEHWIAVLTNLGERDLLPNEPLGLRLSLLVAQLV